jgi:hypothetical protein
VPELLSYLQQIVDARPRPGAFLLTGSQHVGLIFAVTQTLAGRAAHLASCRSMLRSPSR